MKVLITGATGYIGSKLVDKALCRGWHIAILLRAKGRPTLERWKGRIHTIYNSDDVGTLADSLRKFQPDVVVHLASLALAETRTSQIHQLIRSNIEFPSELLDVCASLGINNIINTGTMWQHYNGADYSPTCLYAATKQSFEAILDFYADAFNMSIVTIKLPDTYGPNDPRGKIVSHLIDTLHSGTAIGLSPGEQAIDLLHVDDVVEAFTKAAEMLTARRFGVGHWRYALSGGELLTVRKLVERIESLAGTSLNVQFGARPYRPREMMSVICVNPILPNWKPEVALSVGLRGLIDRADAVAA